MPCDAHRRAFAKASIKSALVAHHVDVLRARNANANSLRDERLLISIGVSEAVTPTPKKFLHKWRKNGSAAVEIDQKRRIGAR
jgi:hypothetical protein